MPDEALSGSEASQTNLDNPAKVDEESAAEIPQNSNSTPTIMQPVVRLQRISSEVHYHF